MGDRILAWSGVVGAATWLALPFFAPPMDSSNAEEIFWSRLWAPALALMALGFVGLARSSAVLARRSLRIGLVTVVIGLLVMAVGNIAEYWLFVDQIHGTMSSRDFSWILLLGGALVTGLGITTVGVLMLALRVTPVWVGLALAAVAPTMIALGALAGGFVGVPLGVAALAAAISVLGSPLTPAVSRRRSA